MTSLIETAVVTHLVGPAQSLAEQDAAYGEQLYARDPDRCCALRTVAPLAQTLAGFDAWVSGLRRDESPTRADTLVVQWDTTHHMVKINPIARWSQQNLHECVAAHDVLVNELLAAGYLSIGARRAPAGPTRAPTPAPGGGRAWRRPSEGSTSDPRLPVHPRVAGRAVLVVGRDPTLLPSRPTRDLDGRCGRTKLVVVPYLRRNRAPLPAGRLR